MPKGFDDDALGAVLEFGCLRIKGTAEARGEWERKSLKGNVGFNVWVGAALERAPLEAALEVGRDREKVKRSLAHVFSTLERHRLIEPHARDDNPATLLRDVTVLGAELLREDAYREFTLGLQFVAKRWRESIVYVYATDGAGIGTGFLVSPRLIVTARHALEELKFKFSVGRGSQEFVVVDVRLPAEKAGDLDLAVVELTADVVGAEPMRLSEHVETLDEVVVFGYPPVPQTRDAHLLVSRGEVSAVVKLHNGYDAVLVTCLLRGGYSGGPVVNRRGQVIGIVSRNLFKEIDPSEKSLNEGLGFAAAVPAVWAQDLVHGKV